MPSVTKAQLLAENQALRESLEHESTTRQQAEKKLAEALEQQTATGEILKVISGSPTDVQPVFDTIAVSARHLCDALYSVVFRFEEGMITLVADDGASPEWIAAIRSAYPAPPGRSSVAALAILERRVIAIADAQGGIEYPHVVERAKAIGYRSIISVPMLRGDTVFGAINVLRTEVLPFSDTQIALLQTFADQAVIAIENVRLFTELQEKNRALTEAHAQVTEALDQQTATAEILRVISGSPTDVQPVMNAVVEAATRLTGADRALIGEMAGDSLYWLASHGGPISGTPVPISRALPTGRAILDRRTTQEADIRTLAKQFPHIAALQDTRTALATPLLREGVAVGVLLVSRREVRPFTDKQIALLQTFADQAVIAIENVRLFKELESRNAQLIESLGQQTATSQILSVISSSPTEIEPVFKTILANTNRLCEASFSILFLWDGEALTAAAHENVPPTLAEHLRTARVRPDRGKSPVALAALQREVVHVPDVLADSRFSPADAPAYRLGGAHSILSVPMLREGGLIGVINTWRLEPSAFTDKQIELLKTFADQAVIAIENVRLFKELEARNRDLTATSEILQVISSSPTDVQPVFDTIVRSAVRLCAAATAAVFRVDGGMVYEPANYGSSPEALAATRRRYPKPLDMETPPGVAILTRAVFQVADTEDPSAVEHVRQTGRLLGVRSIVSVPMLREGEAVGAIVITRREPGRFSEAEVELLQTFADQAVIAIENVRLFKELEARNRDLTEALDQQTATSEILRVISQSPTDIQPVLDAVAASAARLCEAFDASIFRLDDDGLRLVAHHGPIPQGAISEFTLPLARGTVGGRSVLDGRTVHVADLPSEAGEFPEGSEHARRMGHRTILSVPLMRKGVAIGSIDLRRTEVQLFTERQVALLQTFADQAVIAIENVRLFTELEARNLELTTALDQQTATSEILRVISSSPTDVQPVFDSIAQSVRRLCRGTTSAVLTYDGRLIHLVALSNVNPEGTDALRQAFPRPPSRATTTTRAILTGKVVMIPDVLEDPDYALTGPAQTAGFRNALAVPMLREGKTIGGISVMRAEPGPFSESEIQLLQSFADQAVIAIENVRLFTELQEKNRALTQAHAQVTEALEQQTATSEILRVISASPTDVQPVFDAIAANAARLCSANDAQVLRVEGDVLRLVAAFGAPSMPSVRRLTRGHLVGRAVIDRKTIHVRDLAQALMEYPETTAARYGTQSALAVPLLREGAALGVIRISRTEIRPFTDKQITLLQTFADQAVIAIENVRLFKELEARTADLTRSVGQLTALGEVGRAVSSTLDLETVLTTIVSRAVQLSALDGGVVFEYDEDAQEFEQALKQGAPWRRSGAPRGFQRGKESSGGRRSR